MQILVANVGSTSFKFKLFDMADESILAQGKIENIGSDESDISFSSLGKSDSGRSKIATYQQAVNIVINFLQSTVLNNFNELSAVGFKTVHGKGVRECRILDEQTLNAMNEYIFLAPAHNPPYINAIKIFADLVPEIPLVGLFEPAFHRAIPDYAYTYGIPHELAEKHAIRKYGFHGASHRWISERAPELVGLKKEKIRIISCHLGGSSSICAILDGISVDTSMGFSPQSGILNAKRTGDLDPFIPLFLQKAEGLTADQVSDVLQKKSGLLGISGISDNMKDIIEAAEGGNKRASLAIATFCYGIKKYIGSYFTVLGGLDILAFTGGIGERSAFVREKVCQGLDCLGISIDKNKNSTATFEAVVSRDESKVKVVIIPANEELIVAREAQELLISKGREYE